MVVDDENPIDVDSTVDDGSTEAVKDTDEIGAGVLLVVAMAEFGGWIA